MSASQLLRRFFIRQDPCKKYLPLPQPAQRRKTFSGKCVLPPMADETAVKTALSMHTKKIVPVERERSSEIKRIYMSPIIGARTIITTVTTPTQAKITKTPGLNISVILK